MSDVIMKKAKDVGVKVYVFFINTENVSYSIIDRMPNVSIAEVVVEAVIENAGEAGVVRKRQGSFFA